MAFVLAALAACEAEPEADRAAAPVAEAGYHPDSLEWLREGVPVQFDDRLWRPVGQPISEPARMFRAVGEFEGMTLYALKGESEPLEHLFFPFGSDTTWQTLEPVEPEDADTLTAP